MKINNPTLQYFLIAIGCITFIIVFAIMVLIAPYIKIKEKNDGNSNNKRHTKGNKKNTP